MPSGEEGLEQTIALCKEDNIRQQELFMDYVTKRSISAQLAREIIVKARDKASEFGQGFTIAVVDDGGNLKAFERMDGAPLIASQVAQDKAYTAIGFGMPSHGWYDFIKDDGPLALGAAAGINRLVIFGGGFPIESDNQIIGAIGVSGGHYQQDMEIAQAGLSAITNSELSN